MDERLYRLPQLIPVWAVLAQERNRWMASEKPTLQQSASGLICANVNNRCQRMRIDLLRLPWASE